MTPSEGVNESSRILLSEAASPNRRRSLRDLATLYLAGLRRGLAGYDLSGVSPVADCDRRLEAFSVPALGIGVDPLRRFFR